MEKPECFWCTETIGLRNVNEVLMCVTHSKCEQCGAALPGVPARVWTCKCEKYGNLMHEESVWCSDGCWQAAHDAPEPDLDLIAEQEEENENN